MVRAINIEDITYKQYLEWANWHAAAGRWPFCVAIVTCNFIDAIQKNAKKKPWWRFSNFKNEEKYFNEHKYDYLEPGGILIWG